MAPAALDNDPGERGGRAGRREKWEMAREMEERTERVRERERNKGNVWRKEGAMHGETI